MKLNRKILASAGLAAIMAGVLAGCGGSSQTETTTATSATSESANTETKVSSIDYLVLVNKENALPENWENEITLESFINTVDDEVQTETEAYQAYLELKKDLEADGVYVDLDSAYRSVEEQKRIVKDFTEKYGETYVQQYVAVPGYSEHHTGLALDLFLIIDGKVVNMNEDMVKYPEIWEKIHKKLADHGFILRYLEGKESITGYNYEPWHIRYVKDPAVAKEITDKGIVLEEYLNRLPEGDVTPPKE